jgi:hypothetical protein
MKLRILLMFLFGAILLWGCQKWSDPDYIVKEWEGASPNQMWTIGKKTPNDIRNILSKHENGSLPDSIIPASVGSTLRYVRAVVVSSDEGGNYYKSMAVQDSTGAVELQLDMTGLFSVYPVGQKIVLVCNGLLIGDYGTLPQVGWFYNDGVGRINSLFFDKYIIKDGMPSPNNIPKPLTNNNIDFSSKKDLNKLVRLEGVTFQDEAIGEPFSYSHFTTEWKISVPLAGGNTQEVSVRTSNYAKFRSMIIEKREYDLTGILTTYRDNLQLMIRTKDDIKLSPLESVVIDFNSDPMNWEAKDRWSIHPAQSTTAWSYRTNAMTHVGNGFVNLMDDWFISPPLTYMDWQNGYLRFEHQIDVINGFYGAYQIFYTTSTATTFNSADWKPLGELTNFPAAFGWSNPLPLKIINAKTFRIAFRYNANDPDKDTYIWSIKKVEFRNK